MTSLQNFIKIFQLVEKLWGWCQTQKQEGDLISLHFSFWKEGRLKMAYVILSSKVGVTDTVYTDTQGDFVHKTTLNFQFKL
jgi:hypothetical protein